LKRLLLTVVLLVTALPAPALAKPRPPRPPKLVVVLPKKTKNACLRKAARLASTLKYDAALKQLAARGCSRNIKPAEQQWVSLMEGVLYHQLNQASESKESFCLALKENPSARLPLTRPPRPLSEHFEKLRSECQEDSMPEPARAEVVQPVDPATGPALAEVPPTPAAEPPPSTTPTPTPPSATPPPPSAVEPAPPPSDLIEPSPAPSLLGSLQVHAGVLGDVELNLREFRPLGGVGFQGSVLLGYGLRAGLGLSALGTARFSPRPVFVLLADVRLAYPLLPPREQFALHLYAKGGPLLYTLDPTGPGGRAGLGLALDMSRVRFSLSAAYEWRYHYRLEFGAPIVGLEVGWKLFDASP
jgi:hypothetical protein